MAQDPTSWRTKAILKKKEKKENPHTDKIDLPTWHFSAYTGPQKADSSSALQTLLDQLPAGREGVPWAAGWEGLSGSSEFCQEEKQTNKHVL